LCPALWRFESTVSTIRINTLVPAGTEYNGVGGAAAIDCAVATAITQEYTHNLDFRVGLNRITCVEHYDAIAAADEIALQNGAVG